MTQPTEPQPTRSCYVQATARQLDAPLTELVEFGLTDRTVNSLERLGIFTVRDLAGKTPDDLRIEHCIGVGTVTQIADAIRDYFADAATKAAGDGG